VFIVVWFNDVIDLFETDQLQQPGAQQGVDAFFSVVPGFSAYTVILRMPVPDRLNTAI